MKIFKNQKLAKAYLIFFVIFYLVWTAAELVIRPAMNQVIPEDSVLSYLLFDGVIKNLCWTLPALVLITKFDEDLYLHQKELFKNPIAWKDVLPVFLGETAFCVLNSVISHRGFYFNSGKLTECVAFLFVGITEEFVFRAFLLNATLTEENKKFAVGVNALLFLSIHFPIWILYGNFIAYFANFGFVTIILLSIFFSWSMLKFRNIWIPVLLHMLWDILVTLLN